MVLLGNLNQLIYITSYAPFFYNSIQTVHIVTSSSVHLKLKKKNNIKIKMILTVNLIEIQLNSKNDSKALSNIITLFETIVL